MQRWKKFLTVVFVLLPLMQSGCASEAVSSSRMVQRDQKSIEKNYHTLLDICRKYFDKPGQDKKVQPSPKEDALTTLKILSETPKTDYLLRFYAVRILGKCAQPEAKAILLKNLDDLQPDIKVAALHAVADYIEATNDSSLVPVLINSLVLNIAYYADRFEGGQPKGKLYPKNQPNCGLRVVVVNEEALSALQRVLNIEIPFNYEKNRKASAIVETRADAVQGLEKKASNLQLLTQLRDQYLKWWNSEGKAKFFPGKSDK